MEVLAIDVDVAIVIQTNATVLLPNALGQVHVGRSHPNQKVGNRSVGRLWQAATPAALQFSTIKTIRHSAHKKLQMNVKYKPQRHNCEIVLQVFISGALI
jgi:hypothetical protein